MKQIAKVALSISDREQTYMDVTEYKWLGIVYPGDVRPKVVFITPLAFYDKLTWNFISQTENPYYFPNNGKAALFTDDFPETMKNQLLCFVPKENPYPQNLEDQWYSRYQLKDIRSFVSVPFAQILYRTTTAASSFEIPDVLNQGIESEECISKTIYIAFQKYLYGPIKLEQVGNLLKPRQYVHNNGGEELIVSVYPIPADSIHSLGEISPDFDIINEEILPAPIKREDWSLPQAVIKHALQASNTISRQSDIKLVDRRIRELAQLSSANASSAFRISSATIERAEYIVTHQAEQLHDLQSFIDTIGIEHPLMQIAREHIVATQSERVKQTVKEYTQQERDQLLKVRHDKDEADGILNEVNVAIEQAKTELAQLQKDIYEYTQQREQAIEELQQFQQEAQQKLLQLRQEPVRVLAELQFAASLLSVLRSYQEEASQPSTITFQASPPKLIISHEELINWSPNEDGYGVKLHELQNLLRQKKRQTGVSLEFLRLSLASLLAGLIPVLPSTIAQTFLNDLASLIAQNRIWSISVPLTALAPLDLFGTIDKQNRDFIPNADGLADIILQARKHPDDIAIVLFEGIDRVPTMPVLVPLIRSYLNSQQYNQPSTALHLFHSRSLTPDNPYLPLASFSWPENLLLAATCDSDISSLPLPESCSSWFVHLENYKAYTQQHSTPQLASHSNHILYSLWQAWSENRKNNTATDNAEIYPNLDYRQRKFCEVLKFFNVNDVGEIVQKLWSNQFEEQEDSEEDSI